MKYFNNNLPGYYKTIPFLGIGAAIIISMYCFRWNYQFFHDDAFITLRYAQNFINGNGITWNYGEYVEGYTNFFYLLLISLLGLLDVNLILAARIVSFIAYLLIIIATIFYFLVFRKSGRTEPSLAVIPIIFIITAFPLMIWVLGGLEGPLLALFCTLGIWIFFESIEDPRRAKYISISGVCFALACMTRLDAALFAGISIIFLLISKRDDRMKTLLFFILPLLIILTPYMVWKINYYGNILPNTFYVRVVGVTNFKAITGIKYIVSYCLSPPFLLVLLPFAVAISLYAKKFNRGMWYLLTTITVYLIYLIYVGGDRMPAYRLLLPLITPTVLLLYQCLIPFAKNLKPSHILYIYGAVLILVCLQIIDPGLNPEKMDPSASIGKAVGEYIASAFPEDSLIALNTAGSTPFYAPKNRFIDMLGLNDIHIARRKITAFQLPWQRIPGHAKGDGTYVLSRKPDYIIVGPPFGTFIESPLFLSDLEMSRDSRFKENYTPHRIFIVLNSDKTGSQKIPFTYYQRNSLNDSNEIY